MTQRVVLATRNAKKLAELDRLLKSSGIDAQILGSDAFDDLPDIAETGATFAENAVLKAQAVSTHTGLPAIADDSGLCVEALNGMPGILSARWAGLRADDANNLDLVLEQLADVSDERRAAHFACAAAFVAPGMQTQVTQGRVDGVLLRERHGSAGFGYDPIFRPDGFDITTAQMSATEKDAISHRGQAMRALLPHIVQALGR